MSLQNSKTATTKRGNISMPSAPEIEQGVLCMMIVEPECIPVICAKLEPVHFMSDKNRRIFEAIRALWKSGSPVDETTLYEKLKLHDMAELTGGLSYISELVMKSASSANADYYCGVLIEKYSSRRLLEVANQLMTDINSGASIVSDLISSTTNEVTKIQNGLTSKKDFISADEAGNRLLDRIEFYENNKGKHVGLSIGYPKLEKYIRGLEPAEYVIIAARPSMGKSAFAINIMCNLSFAGHKVAVFVLESSVIKLWERIGCRMTMITQDDLIYDRISPLKKVELQSNISRIKGNNNIWMCEDGYISLPILRAKCQYAVERYGVELIIIDHIGRINHRSESLNMGMGEISSEIKSIASSLQVPIIAIHQLNRSVEHRENKRPMLSDLRDSGTLEQDADKVLFLYRDNYYKMKNERLYAEDGSEEVEMLISKNRDGQSGKNISMLFYPQYGLFTEMPN